MAEDIFLGGKTYVSSKKAAKECGYAQDYVGQLARGGIIDAQRVGGLWYVSMDSLEAYKRNSDNFTPKPPVVSSQSRDLDTIVSFDGKDYVSSSRASKLTGYNPDYVGQLARSGKVLSRQIGNRWYVERDGLLSHKAQKDSLLASVQAEAVGLYRQQATVSMPSEVSNDPHFTYVKEDKHLMPVLSRPEVKPVDLSPVQFETDRTHIPIRVVPKPIQRTAVAGAQRAEAHIRKPMRVSGLSISKATKAVGVLTVVVVLSYGFTSIKSDSMYALVSEAAPASVGQITEGIHRSFEGIMDKLEALVAPAIEYSRD